MKRILPVETGDQFCIFNSKIAYSNRENACTTIRFPSHNGFLVANCTIILLYIFTNQSRLWYASFYCELSQNQSWHDLMSVFLKSFFRTSCFGQFVNGVISHHKNSRPLRFNFVTGVGQAGHTDSYSPILTDHFNILTINE